MKAIVIEEFGGNERLKLKEIPKPQVKDNEVLIKVADAGVNPVDWKIREGHYKDAVPHEFPLTLGWDVSGTIVECGKNVHDLKPGDEIFAFIRSAKVHNGSYAEYVTFDSKQVVKKPRSLSFAEAASIPLAALTAWQSLFDTAQLKKGETILILGGSGGVGCMAIQLAKSRGAKVIATASVNKHPYVKKYGADIVIDRNGNIPELVKSHAHEGVDVILDTVGGQVYKKSLACLKKGGRLVSLIEQPNKEEAKRLGILEKFIFVAPNADELRKIAQMIDEKQLKTPQIEEMPMRDAAKALEKIKTGKVTGKIVLKAQF